MLIVSRDISKNRWVNFVVLHWNELNLCFGNISSIYKLRFGWYDYLYIVGWVLPLRFYYLNEHFLSLTIFFGWSYSQTSDTGELKLSRHANGWHVVPPINRWLLWYYTPNFYVHLLCLIWFLRWAAPNYHVFFERRSLVGSR